MTEPGLSGSRDRGLGDEHARYKRSRGGEDGGERGGKRVRREYDGDGHDYEERGSRRRSASPRDETRESRHRSRNRYHHRHSGGDYVSQQLKSKSIATLHRERRETSYLSRATEHSPSTSSTRRHHHSHHRHYHHHRHRHASTPSTHTQDELPFSARPLVRSDLDAFTPLFAQYLEVQKNKDVTTMDERELRGRWKSFIGKWNRGDLAAGWYRAETLDEARKGGYGFDMQTHADNPSSSRIISPRERSQDRVYEERGDMALLPEHRDNRDEEEEDESDSYGPTLPPGSSATNAKHGPGIPSLQDLSLRRENAAEERDQRIADLRLERKLDRKKQRERLDELVPRAEAGTRERMLEKKREVGDKMRAFREKSPDGGGGEVGEQELMGGGDSVAEYKRMKKEAERRRTEKEVRREEEERAREAEREERRRLWREREEGVMEGLRRIARERFG